MDKLERSVPQLSEQHLEEKCGLVALHNPTDIIRDQVTIALAAADGVQHRGQLGAGIALQTDTGIRTHFGDGLLKKVFTPEIRAQLGEEGASTWALVHCRYGTSGGYDNRNLQPTMTPSEDGTMVSVIHNGQFVALDSMRQKVTEQLPMDISDTYLFSKKLAESAGPNWDERVLEAVDEAQGAFSLGIGIENTLYLARDNLGIRPFVMGKLHNGWIATSETHALDKIGVKVEREIKRGEVIRINEDGMTILRDGFEGPGNYCDFEWDYFSRPNSLAPTYDQEDDATHPERWLSSLVVRERSGHILASEKPIPHASFVVGAPDSGVAVATGYAAGMKIPYRQIILRDHFNENGALRLFQDDRNMESIGSKVLGKLSLASGPNTWKDAVVVVGDDSIVRGNVSGELTEAMFSAGAKEVHYVIGFPQVMHPCHLGVSMRTYEELIAVRNEGDPQKIAKEIGATSVNYISHEGFIKSRKLSNIVIPEDPRNIFLENGGCGGCLTGRYPISRNGEVFSRAITK